MWLFVSCYVIKGQVIWLVVQSDYVTNLMFDWQKSETLPEQWHYQLKLSEREWPKQWPFLSESGQGIAKAIVSQDWSLSKAILSLKNTHPSLMPWQYISGGNRKKKSHHIQTTQDCVTKSSQTRWVFHYHSFVE